MIIQVTAQDIAAAGQKARDNPITRAMQRVTQQQWIVFDGHTAHELSLPYRSVKLPEPVATHWRHYRETGLMHPFEFEFAALPGAKPALPSTLNTLAPTPAANPVAVKHDLAPAPSVAQTEDAVRRQQLRDRRRQDRRLTDRRRQERRHYAERRNVQRASATTHG